MPIVPQLGLLAGHTLAGPAAVVVYALALLGMVCAPLIIWRGRLRRREAHSRRQVDLDLFLAARRDSLTQLAGRALFIDRLATCLKAQEAAALLVIEIDRLAGLNTRYGLRVGDDVVLAVADRLRALAGERPCGASWGE